MLGGGVFGKFPCVVGGFGRLVLHEREQLVLDIFYISTRNKISRLGQSDFYAQVCIEGRLYYLKIPDITWMQLGS